MPAQCNWRVEPAQRALCGVQTQRRRARAAEGNLKLQFEAVSKLSKKERETVKTVIDSILLMHDAKRYTSKERVA